jgi:acyl-CoA reductase-like NAD-dependent aldehyde dehydrogenase
MARTPTRVRSASASSGCTWWPGRTIGCIGRFVSGCKRRWAAIKVGDPQDPTVLVGPMIDEPNARRVESWVAEAVSLGARRLCGGERQGTFFATHAACRSAPQWLGSSATRSSVRCVTWTEFASFEAALAAVNDSRFGLQAAVFTHDLGHALRAHEETVRRCGDPQRSPELPHRPHAVRRRQRLGTRT